MPARYTICLTASRAVMYGVHRGQDITQDLRRLESPRDEYIHSSEPLSYTNTVEQVVSSLSLNIFSLNLIPRTSELSLF